MGSISGSLASEQLLSARIFRKITSKLDRLEKLFKIIDVDHDGYITWVDVQVIIIILKYQGSCFEYIIPEGHRGYSYSTPPPLVKDFVNPKIYPSPLVKNLFHPKIYSTLVFSTLCSTPKFPIYDVSRFSPPFLHLKNLYWTKNFSRYILSKKIFSGASRRYIIAG